MTIVLKVYGAHKSILGVCLGQQTIVEYFGGKLENLYEVKHGVSSELYHYDNCNLFANIDNKFLVGHYHSWVVSKDLLPNELEVTAVNSEGLIMAIKHRELDIKALQFHPEVDFMVHIRWLFLVLMKKPTILFRKGSQNLFYQLFLRFKYNKSISLWLDSFLDNYLLAQK